MEWIKIKDEPIPKKGKFLAIDKYGDQAVVWYEDNYLIRGGWFGSCEYGCGGHDYFENVTHWMPLPYIPKE